MATALRVSALVPFTIQEAIEPQRSLPSQWVGRHAYTTCMRTYQNVFAILFVCIYM